MTATIMTGVVKSFDPAKGFGFVIIDGPEPREDALLHISVLRAINATKISPNRRITCECVRGAKGLAVHRILELEGANETVEDTTDFVQAQVKWYSASRGYGFVTVEGDDRDIFVHAEIVKAAMIADLQTGGFVLVKIQSGARGRRVTAIMAFTPGPVQPE